MAFSKSSASAKLLVTPNYISRMNPMPKFQIPSLPIICLPLFVFYFYWFTHERHGERGRDIGRGRSRLLAGGPMWDFVPGPRITPWAEAKRSNTEPPRRPYMSSFECAMGFSNSKYLNLNLPNYFSLNKKIMLAHKIALFQLFFLFLVNGSIVHLVAQISNYEQFPSYSKNALSSTSFIMHLKYVPSTSALFCFLLYLRFLEVSHHTVGIQQIFSEWKKKENKQHWLYRKWLTQGTGKNLKDIFNINIFWETFMRNFSIKEGQTAVRKELSQGRNNFLEVTITATTTRRQQWLNNRIDTAENPINNLEEPCVA